MKVGVFITILALACATWWFTLQHEKPARAKASWQEKYPQEYMHEVSVLAFTEEGFLKHEVSADYWAYLPSLKASHLSAPHLTLYKPDNTVWLIDAKRGHVTQPTLGSIEQVELSESVVLQRPASANVMPVILATEKLRYQPRNQYAETEMTITLTKPDLTITGQGMRADLDTNSVELLHNVKSNFVGSLQ